VRELSILNIKDVKHLCKHLGTSKKELDYICRCIQNHYYQSKRTIKGKIRLLATPKDRLREILDRLQVLLQRISLPDYIHGGRKGHSNITNAFPHIKKHTIINLDLKDFFPNIKYKRIYKVFFESLGCSPEVARYLTRLTTLNGSLPQGSPTSTILAALVGAPLAKRVKSLVQIHHASYSQYVDDITISGSQNIEYLIPTIKKIIKQEGFLINPAKIKVKNRCEEQIVTGVRVNNGIDAPRSKIKEASEQIEKIVTQAKSGVGNSRIPLISTKGKINYIKQLNKGAGRFLQKRLYNSINIK